MASQHSKWESAHHVPYIFGHFAVELAFISISTEKVLISESDIFRVEDLG